MRERTMENGWHQLFSGLAARCVEGATNPLRKPIFGDSLPRPLQMLDSLPRPMRDVLLFRQRQLNLIEAGDSRRGDSPQATVHFPAGRWQSPVIPPAVPLRPRRPSR